MQGFLRRDYHSGGRRHVIEPWYAACSTSGTTLTYEHRMHCFAAGRFMGPEAVCQGGTLGHVRHVSNRRRRFVPHNRSRHLWYGSMNEIPGATITFYALYSSTCHISSTSSQHVRH